MPDVISQAAPEEEITPEAEGTEQEEAPVPQTEKPLTAEDYRQIAREEAMRIAQSQVAKGENRINQQIAERFAALEVNKSVLKLTDEQVQAAQDQIIREEQVNAYAPKEAQANGPQASPNEIVNRQVEFVYSQIGATFEEVGTAVTPNDAEWKTIESALNDPKGSLARTLRATNQAAEAKAARVAAQQKKAPARVTSTGGEQGPDTGYDPNKPASFYLEKAEKEQRKS